MLRRAGGVVETLAGPPLWMGHDCQRNLDSYTAVGHPLRPAFLCLTLLSAAAAGLSRPARRLFRKGGWRGRAPAHPVPQRARLRRGRLLGLVLLVVLTFLWLRVVMHWALDS